ncbi:MAG: amino acid permease [Pseudomonadales bacterium]|nr:amino acid permease [Pseudomonadales bacterium]
MSTFRPVTATAVVVANMIGTGVFTSLGFQLLDIESGFPLMMLWAVGGLTALCGALTYAELGATLPRSGGEYNFLTEIYHPGAGFISGWISATIGFAAPVALAAITFGTYLASVFPSLEPVVAACLLVVLLTGVHSTSHRSSGEVQTVFTALKVLAILGFCSAALLLAPARQPIDFLPAAGDGALIAGGAFAVSLIFVNYAYTGWNAATYLTNEIAEPQRHMPRILVGGTAAVMALYLLLNFTFLYVAPIDAMKGKVEIGYIAATFAFGEAGGQIMAVVLAALLISTVSAMIMAGPRVLQVIGQDINPFRLLAVTNRDGIPVVAIVVQSLLTLVFILTSTFESILVFSGFVLAINTLFAVGGIYVLRWRDPRRERPYRTFGYPVTPAIYLLLNLWTLTYIAMERPEEALFGIALILVGGMFYVVAARFNAR